MTDFGHAEEDERNVSRTRGTKDFLPSKGMLVTRLAASDRVEDTYCDCCGVVGAMDETGDDYGSPIQIPYDDSNCPSCIMKSMGIILNPAVEVQRQPEEFSAFSGVLSFEAVAFGCRLVESANSPPSDSHQVFHLRI